MPFLQTEVWSKLAYASKKLPFNKKLLARKNLLKVSLPLSYK
jgi:hypothetical protein